MKSFAILLVVTLYVSANQYPMDFDFDIKEIIKQKCDTKTGGEAYTDLMDTIQQAQECMTNVEEAKPLHRSKDYCLSTERINDLYDCVKGVGEKLPICLEEEEAFLPEYLEGVFNHSLTRFCGDEGLTKLTCIMQSIMDSRNCLKTSYLRNNVRKCIAESFNITSNTVDTVLVVKQSEICSNFANMENCINEANKDQCSEEDHSKAVHYLIEPFLFDCEKKIESS